MHIAGLNFKISYEGYSGKRKECLGTGLSFNVWPTHGLGWCRGANKEYVDIWKEDERCKTRLRTPLVGIIQYSRLTPTIELDDMICSNTTFIHQTPNAKMQTCTTPSSRSPDRRPLQRTWLSHSIPQHDWVSQRSME